MSLLVNTPQWLNVVIPHMPHSSARALARSGFGAYPGLQRYPSITVINDPEGQLPPVAAALEVDGDVPLAAGEPAATSEDVEEEELIVKEVLLMEEDFKRL